MHGRTALFCFLQPGRVFLFRTEDRRNNKNRHAASDARVRYIERWPVESADMELKKIYNFPPENPVCAVSDDSGRDQEQGIDPLGIIFGKALQEKNDSGKRRNGNQQEKPSFSRKHTPGGSGIGDVSDIEEIGNDDLNGVKGDRPDDHFFCELIDQIKHNSQRDGKDCCAIGFFQAECFEFKQFPGLSRNYLLLRPGSSMDSRFSLHLVQYLAYGLAASLASAIRSPQSRQIPYSSS